MEDLDKNTLRYLAGVKQKVDECMGAMTTQIPPTPASISVTAGSGEELSGMLKSLMTLAGVSPVTPSHMPVDDPSKGPSKVISAPPMSQSPDMKTLLAAMDEKDVEEDSMNPDDQHDWDNSPSEEGKAVGDWPMDGDQDNNLSANKDKVVDRHNVTAEGLFAAYEDFVAESKKSKCCCKEKGKKKCPVHSKVDEAFHPLLPKQKAAQKSADKQSVAQSGKVGAGAGPEMKGTGRVPMQSKEKTKYVRDRAAKFSEELEQTEETLNVEEAKKWVKKAVKGIKKGALRKQEGKKKGEKFSKGELKGLAKSGTPKEKKRAQFALNISKKK
jgi:hypothetical protein